MKKQKSSKKRLAIARAARKPRRRRAWDTARLERVANTAVIKLGRRIDRRGSAAVTHDAARQIASELARSAARKHGFGTDTDEYRHVLACLRERADALTGHHHPELYEI